MPASKFIDISLGRWIPDWGGSPNVDEPGYLVIADNVYLSPFGYKPLPGFSSVTGLSTVTNDPKAGSMFVTGGSTVLDVFAGTSVNIYQSGATGDTTWDSWTDVTPSVAPNTSLRWNFAQFDDLILAVNDHRSDSIWEKSLTDATSTIFAPLGGSPPVCSDIARVRNHVVVVTLGASIGDDNDYAVQWCAIGDPTDWPTPGSADALSKESGKEFLPRELGQVVGVQGGEKFGLIFQENGITRMTYVGGDVVFEFDTYEKTSGGSELNPSTYVWHGKWLYFEQPDQGVFRTDGYRTERVSAFLSESIFLDGLAHTYGSHKSSSSALDSSRENIYFMAPSATQGSGSAAALVHNINTGGWSIDSNSAFDENVFDGPGGLGDVARRIWNVNSSHQPQTNTNTSAPSIDMQTAYIEIEPGRKVELEGVHLVGRELPGNLTIAYKALQDYDSIDMAETGFTSLTSQSRGIKDTGRAKGLLFAFKITGASDLNQNIKSMRVYYRAAEPI